MKKLFIILLVSMISTLGLFAVDKSAQSKNDSTIVITGYIVSKGNMPFNFPAIKTQNGTEYLFTCTARQKKKLLKLQGRDIRFTLLQNEDGALVLKKYKVLK
ncbi:MAG: hypothetical protein IKR64_06510 [Treponema sp.]|nr:hypothetical protein [Treponema sp.]